MVNVGEVYQVGARMLARSTEAKSGKKRKRSKK